MNRFYNFFSAGRLVRALSLGLCLFCSLFTSPIGAATITWTAGGTGNWSDASKWGGAVPTSADVAVIADGDVTLDVSATITQLQLNSAAGVQGKLTISSGMTLTATGVNNTASVFIAGGLLVNSGTLMITTLGSGAGMVFSTAVNLSIATGYSGAGALNINSTTGTGNAISFNSTPTLNIPSMDFGGTTTLAIPTNRYVINVNASVKGSIKGTLSLPTANYALIQQFGNGSELTIETGANISIVGNTTNTTIPINLSNTAASSTLTFTNKGTISISGYHPSTLGAGLKFTGLNNTTTTTFDNQGTFTANLRIPINGNGVGNFELKNSGVSPKGMYLTNPATTSPAILFNTTNCVDDVTVTNSGTLDMHGTSGTLLGSKGSLTNTGTITTDFEMAGGILITINNNTNGVLNFTGLSSVANTNAIPFAKLVNGGGTINTGKSGTGTTGTTNGVNIIGSTNTYTSGTLSPGGTSFMSIMNLKGGVALPVTLEMQVSGATTAGTDYDQILATGMNVGFNLTGATLNLTSAYTPGGTTAIDVVKPIGTGTITCTTCINITSGAYSGYKVLPSTGVSTWSAVITPTGTAAQLVFPAVVLPIELVSFTATPLSKSNKLVWVTATESNNKGFDIQRQTQIGDWESLGFVNAQGKAANYTFEDKAPLSISYYRLRQVDLDGTVTLSKVVSVNSDKKATTKVYPTLVKDIINVEFSANNGATDVLIVNLLGQVVKAQKLQNTEGVTPMNISDLSTGSYIMRLVSKSGSESYRFEKQ